MLTTGSGTAVAQAFGLGPGAVLVGPTARGEQGRVWRLVTPGGDYAVKEPLSGGAHDEAEAEYDAALQDACHAAGVPMPALVRSTGGRVVEEVDGSRVRLYAWLDVQDPNRLEDPAAVGALLAGIHRVVVPPGGGVRDWFTRPVGEAGWWSLVERLAAAGAPFTDDLAAVVPELLAAERLIVPMPAERRCHLDLWSDNVRRAADGRLVVLDWEEAGPGHPRHELALVLFDFCFDSPGRMADLAASYVANGGPARLRRPSDVGSLVAQLGNIGRIGCERWLATAAEDGAERRHLETWVRELVEEPLTVGRAELMVDAVRGIA